jgi:hypothetical protein
MTTKLPHSPRENTEKYVRLMFSEEDVQRCLNPSHRRNAVKIILPSEEWGWGSTRVEISMEG